MKIFLTLMLLVFAFSKISAQEGGDELGWMEMEIFMMTTGLNQGETVRYELEAMGTVWRAEETSPPSGYEISNNHNLAYYPILTKPETGNTNFNNLNTIWGYNWMQPFITYYHSYDSVAHGLYKVSIAPGDQYFYLDYRDDRYNWQTVYTHAPGGLDIWILYNKSLNRFMYRRQGLTNPNPQYWTQVQKGDYVGLWTIKEVSKPTTGSFPNFWTNCLSVGNDGNSHPRLVWGPYPSEIGIYEYRIYREYGGWHLLASVDADVYTYVDETVFINPPGGGAGTDVYYYVKGVYMENPPDPTETTPTNTVIVNVPGKEIDKQSEEPEINNKSTFSLSQNYPNPFNPTTIISYSIPNKERVIIKIFDVFGSEVTTLEDGYKESGSYQIGFNGEGLASGIYFYSLDVGNYRKTGKMILQKQIIISATVETAVAEYTFFASSKRLFINSALYEDIE